MFIGGALLIRPDDKVNDIDLKIAKLKDEFDGKVTINLDKRNNIIYYHQLISFKEIDKTIRGY